MFLYLKSRRIVIDHGGGSISVIIFLQCMLHIISILYFLNIILLYSFKNAVETKIII